MKSGSFSFSIESKTLDAMISIYCRKQHHKENGLCQDCCKVRDYALLKLEECHFGAKKPNCVYCPIHCYEPAMREQIRKIMRHSGPLMIKYHPLLAMIHIARRFRKKPVMGKRNERHSE